MLDHTQVLHKENKKTIEVSSKQHAMQIESLREPFDSFKHAELDTKLAQARAYVDEQTATVAERAREALQEMAENI